MSRYSNIPTNTTNKIRVRNTVYYPVIKPSDDDIIVEPTKKRLDYLAYQYYNDSSLWWIIALANGITDGSFNIPSRLNEIRIPQNTSEIITEFNNLNK